MTLQEVLDQIPQKKWSKRVPSVSLMFEQDSPVFYDALDDETSVAIYSSGFVLFQKGEHATVFPLHDCKDYVYKTVEEEIVVPFSEFADQPSGFLMSSSETYVLYSPLRKRNQS